MVPKIGIIITEVKFYSGDIYCTCDKEWEQIKKPALSPILAKNASKQVLRTRALLKKLLSSQSLNHWPIKPLVIFVHPDAKIYKAKEPKSPQTEIIRLEMLENWIKNLTSQTNISFTKNDFQAIYAAIKYYEEEYQAA